ncbi:MAG: lipase family protein [Gammaproteobacteria bacterium]|nr:MAG: lipase family protein [Gammaproteobacteria bacterium]
MKPVPAFLTITLFCLSTTLPANDQNAVNFTEIREKAMFADAAYRPESEIRALVESSDYELTLYHTTPGIQVAFFLATSAVTETQIISIRGTANIENAMVDVSLKLSVDADTGVSLHEGFAYSAKQVYAELMPLLKPEYKINVTGHSMGGAVALILAIFLDKDQFKVDQVVTFGQPKVTNVQGANTIQHINVLRVVTPHDLVPLVPLFDPLDISNIDIFWHAGREVILLEDTRYAVLEGLDSMLRATRFTQKPLSEENIKNHQMSVYLNLIDARVTSSEQVPYKTDFNLFNLFGSE